MSEKRFWEKNHSKLRNNQQWNPKLLVWSSSIVSKLIFLYIRLKTKEIHQMQELQDRIFISTLYHLPFMEKHICGDYETEGKKCKRRNNNIKEPEIECADKGSKSLKPVSSSWSFSCSRPFLSPNILYICREDFLWYFS